MSAPVVTPIAEARSARAKQLRDEARLFFREADELRRLANEADQRGLEAEQAAWELEPW